MLLREIEIIRKVVSFDCVIPILLGHDRSVWFLLLTVHRFAEFETSVICLVALAEKLGGVVQPIFQNPYPDQGL